NKLILLASVIAAGCGITDRRCLCPAIAYLPPVLVHVVDATTNQPLAQATFSVSGKETAAYCQNAAPPDGGSECVGGWRLHLIGPVLAAQFGFLPGLLWILVGVTLGGAVHDFVILTASVRHEGRSLAEIARAQIGPVAGAVAAIAIFFTVLIAIAAMGFAVVN